MHNFLLCSDSQDPRLGVSVTGTVMLTRCPCMCVYKVKSEDISWATSHFCGRFLRC